MIEDGLRGHPLIGTWQLVSHETVFENAPPVRHFGDRPRGRLMLSDTGQMMGFVAAEGRVAGASDAARASLHASMVAYSGTFRVAGDQFIVAVDLAWNEAWCGTEQGRSFTIEGDRLAIVSAPGPSALRPGMIGFSRLAWQREP